MRVAVGGFQVASNTFASQPMDLANFQRGTVTGDAMLALGPGHSALWGFLKGAREQQWDVAPLAFIQPALYGKVTRDAYEWAKDHLLSGLRAARVKGPLDGVFIQMHGTAGAEHVDDCEGDLLAAIHELVGASTPILGTLDGHANCTPKMVANADFLIGVKTNPHSDFNAIGYRAAQVLAGMREGRTRPVMSWTQPPLVTPLQKLFIAPGWPMEHLIRVSQNLRRRDARIIDITIPMGFFVSERHETGMSVLVTTDNEPALARDIANDMKSAIWDMRHAFHTDMVSLEDAVGEAMEADEAPVILGDLADSGGAGTPGDGTAILAELLRRGARGAVIGSIADPAAVDTAMRAGIGGKFSMAVGGKVDRFHGNPVHLSGRVVSLHSGTYTTGTAFISRTIARGPIAVVDCDGIEVILTSRSVLPFEANHFRSLGIEPTQRKIIVCKAEMQQRAGFAGLGKRFIDVDTPGLATQVLSRQPYRKIRRPVFPLDNFA